MNSLPAINEFLSQPVWAVAGVSRDKKKFGSYLYLTLKKRGRKVIPVNPNMQEFDGETCYDSIDRLPPYVNGLVVCTPPNVSKGLISDAISHGIRQIWLQQGAENDEVLDSFRDSGINLISGKCLLMYAEPVDSFHSFHRFLAKLFGKFGK
jgi:hypothetical protein